MKVTLIPIVISAFDRVTKALIKGIEDWRTWRSGDHPNYSIIENGQNTEKSPGKLRRLVVTRTQVENHQLTSECKTLK